ncbi:hypothetical protein GGI26_006469, partial [Coemansia sp. RSA 1358]
EGAGVHVVKYSLQSVGWRKEYDERLQALVRTTHELTACTFQLIRWIFVHELEEDSLFDSGGFLDQNFFSEVFQHLTGREEWPNVAKKTKRWRDLIKRHLPDYMAVTGIEPIALRALGQAIGYEATKIKTAYLNNIKMRSGQHLRCAINVLLNTRAEKKAPRKEMAGRLKNEFLRECEARIWLLAKQVKEAIRHRHPATSKLGPKAQRIVEELKPILGACSANYEFAEDSIYCDAKNSLQRYLKAFSKLARFFERRAAKCFQCFPLRTSWVSHILGPEHRAKDSDETSWNKMLGLGCKAVRLQKGKRSWDAIQTDDVSVSIINMTGDAKKKGGHRRRKKVDSKDAPAVDGNAEGSPEQSKAGAAEFKSGQGKQRKAGGSDDCHFINEVSKSGLAAASGKCVLIDPGRHDLLFCMHKSDMLENLQAHRYIQNQKAGETRSTHFRSIRAKLKDRHAKGDIQGTEEKLAQVANRTVDSVKYQCYVGTWAERLAASKARDHPLHWKLQLSAYINQQRADARLAKNLWPKFRQDAVLVMDNWSAPMN